MDLKIKEDVNFEIIQKWLNAKDSVLQSKAHILLRVVPSHMDPDCFGGLNLPLVERQLETEKDYKKDLAAFLRRDWPSTVLEEDEYQYFQLLPLLTAPYDPLSRE